MKRLVLVLGVEGFMSGFKDYIFGVGIWGDFVFRVIFSSWFRT